MLEKQVCMLYNLLMLCVCRSSRHRQSSRAPKLQQPAAQAAPAGAAKRFLYVIRANML